MAAKAVCSKLVACCGRVDNDSESNAEKKKREYRKRLSLRPEEAPEAKEGYLQAGLSLICGFKKKTPEIETLQ